MAGRRQRIAWGRIAAVAMLLWAAAFASASFSRCGIGACLPGCEAHKPEPTDCCGKKESPKCECPQLQSGTQDAAFAAHISFPILELLPAPRLAVPAVPSILESAPPILAPSRDPPPIVPTGPRRDRAPPAARTA